MTDSNLTYLAYLLRLWRESPGDDWRATLKDAHSGQQLSFATIPQLIDFLLEQTTSAEGNFDEQDKF